MRHNVNENLIARRAKLAKILSLAGLGSLLAAALLMNRMPLLSWAALLLGMVSSGTGANLAAIYVRQPTAEQALKKALAEFDNHHVLYSFLLPVQHVFATPVGVWVILVKKQPGQFAYDGEKWHQGSKLSRLLTFFGEPALGNPLRDLERDIATVGQKLTQELPDSSVPIDGVVVFTDPRTSLDVKGTSRPIITVENLRGFFRRALKRESPLPPEIQSSIVRVLDEWAS